MKTSMGKRLGSLLLTLVFLLGMLPAMEQSARAAITDWAELQTALDAGGTVTLYKDYTAASTDGALSVPAGKSVTLDLNGHILDRGLTSAASNGHVIGVLGNLTIQDSDPTAAHTPAITYHDPVADEDVTVTGGVITGGYGTGNGGNTGSMVGGGVCVCNTSGANATVTMTGGTIVGNRADQGAGVYIGYNRNGNDSGTFTMTGGKICGNDGEGVYPYAGSIVLGGTAVITGNTGAGVTVNGTLTMSGSAVISNNNNSGVNVSDGSSFTMNGGTIQNNLAQNGGGVKLSGDYDGAATLIMNGGSITGNSAFDETNSDPGRGGGVYGDKYSVIRLNGGSITGNTANGSGGGIYKAQVDPTQYPIFENSFTVQGGVNISGNTANGSADNVCLAAADEYDDQIDAVITVTGALGSSASIGVTRGGTPAAGAAIAQGGAPASGGSAYTLTASDAEKFSYDSDSFAVSLDSTNNKLVLTAASSSSITTWAELQTALSAGGTVTLTQDVTAAADDSPLAITSGVTATLDLNGKTLTANNTMSASTSLGSSNMAILVQSGGALTVRDTGTGGKINGNGATYGVYLNDGTATACPSFTLEGGTISGCSSYGVKIMGGNNSSYQPTFTMTGGTISGNTRGGVSTSAAAYSLFNMSGGTITGNGGAAGSSTYNYGGVYISGGTFTMSGGSITANGGTYGGVCLYADIGTCVLNMSGGSITNNTGSIGGGVYVNRNTSNAYPYTAQFKLSGNPTISGNTANGAANNVCLIKGGDAQTVVTVTGALTNTTPIGVTLGDGYSGAFTSGLSGKGAAENFTSDDETKHVALNASSEAILASGGAITSWSALQTALNAGGTVTLTQNLTATDGDSSLLIASGVTVTLDLNGKTLNSAGKTAYDDYEAVFYVSGGSLTVTDGASDGKIAGYAHRGVFVASGAFTLAGGRIDGSLSGSERPTGVVVQGGTFTMSGGTISGNVHDYNGGGVYVDGGGTFTMTGGAISGNQTNIAGSSTGGGVYVNGGTFTMSGGTISGNSAVNGGGVYVTGANGKFIMSGGTINGNKSRVNGGGVYVGGGTFQLSGGVTIQSNVSNCTESSNTLSGGMANNVYLAADKIIAVANSLSSTAGTIGVTAADPAANRVIAQGDNYYMTQTDGGKFTCENQAFGASYGENKVMLSPLSFGISYELDGGALASGVTNPSSYDVTSAAITLNNPTKTGYDFAGWTGTGLTGAATDVTIPTGSTGARSYTATWTIKQYTITFVTGNGGTAITPITQDYNTAVTAPADPTREGYHFDGWDMAIPETMPAENLTITARWSGVSWSLSDGVLTITGSGAMPDYTKGAAPWFARRAEIQSVVFRSTAAPITHIGNYAFYACGAIRSVSVDSVGMSVGDYAFAYCAALQSVVDADGGGARFGDVGKRAFYACFSLSTANRPAVQGAQGDGAFDLCGLN